MSFDRFQTKIGDLITRTDPGLSVDFQNDEEHGKYIARISDGTTIIGNPSGLKMTVRWGSGHSAMADI